MALTNAQRQARYRNAGRAARMALGTLNRPLVRSTEMINLTLADLTRETQRQMDDASEDHYYVGHRIVDNGVAMAEMGHQAFGMEWGDQLENYRRAEALQFAMVATTKLQRANGCVGRIVCWFRASECGLEGHLDRLTNAGQAFAHGRRVDGAD